MPVDPPLAAQLRRELLDCGFTVDGVLARIGTEAFAALGRDLLEPVRRALSGRLSAAPSGESAAPSQERAVDALIRLFLLGETIPADNLPAGLCDGLESLGLATRSARTAGRAQPDRLQSGLDLRPYGEADSDWFLASNRGAPRDPDHVLGLGGASLTLARITPRDPVATALDLGSGAGVQVLHAASYATRVVATDINPRALHLTELSARLSAVPAERLELRQGSLFAPVAGEHFDLIVANPPFVISPAPRFAYRDAGLPADELSRSVVRGAADHLAPGGRAVILANWLHRRDEPWQERVGSWLAGLGLSAWVVQRDAQNVVDYAAMWLRDSGTDEADLDAALGEWLDEFAAHQADGVGFGWVVMVAPDSAAGEPWTVIEDLAACPRLPDGDEVRAFLDGCDRVARLGAVQLLAADLRLATGVQVTRSSLVLDGREVAEPPRLGRPGSIGPGGWRPSEPVPQALVDALLDPASEPLGQRLDRAAARAGVDPLDVLPVALTRLRELVRVGIVRP